MESVQEYTETVDKKSNMGTAPATSRLNLNLSPKSRAEVDSLAEETNRSISELVRLALSLLKLVYEERAAGHKLIVTTGEGKPVKEIVIPGI